MWKPRSWNKQESWGGWHSSSERFQGLWLSPVELYAWELSFLFKMLPLPLPSITNPDIHLWAGLLGAQSYLRNAGGVPGHLWRMPDLARCSIYLLLTPTPNDVKQQPIYYAYDFVGQEFRQSTVGVAYLHFTMLGASKVAPVVRDSWDQRTRALCLGLQFCLLLDSPPHTSIVSGG